MTTLWDKPKGAKKNWNEYTETEKENIERYSELKRQQALRYHAKQRKAKRIARKNKAIAKANWKEMMDKGLVDTVGVINWVEDTPRSLALQFTRWRNAKQR